MMELDMFVVGARGAAGLPLTVASEVFEESGRSLVCGTLDYLQGLKMLGVKRTERVLPMGIPLTVVGEVLLERVLAAAAQRQGQDTEDDKSALSPDNAKRDRIIPDICVICLEQEYNAVFVPCGHMCCCTNCSSHLTNRPLCRRRIDQAVKTFLH